MVDPLVDHGGKLTPLVGILLGTEIELVQDDLDCLEKLLMCEFEVLVSYGHLEVRIDQIAQSIDVILTDNCWQGARYMTLGHTGSLINIRLTIDTVRCISSRCFGSINHEPWATWFNL